MSANSHQTANRAILALSIISILGICAGVLVAWVAKDAGAVVALVSGAIGGIVAIVLRQNQNGNGKEKR